MHPWHDINFETPAADGSYPVVIEVPRGSKNKYEIDKETGLLRLDRVLFSAVHYPANYGFVPRTLCEDGDALDVLVLGQQPVHPLTIVEARSIGGMRMRDEMGMDDKLIAVSVHDPAFSDYQHHDELPKHILRELKRFFEDYKTLELKGVLVEEFVSPEEANVIFVESMRLYNEAYS